MTVARLDRDAPAPVVAPVDTVASPRRPRWRWLLAPLGVLAVFGAHLALAWPMRVPIIHPDELGYLLNARVLARGGVRSPVEYYPGFSLLLVPLWVGAVSSLRVFRETLGVQAGLSAVLAVLGWALSGVVAPSLAGWRRVVVVGAVCTYPAYLLYSDLALSEVAFAAGFTGVVLLFAWACNGVHTGRWWILGLAAGLLVSVHPRGLAVVVAVGLVGCAVLGLRPRAWPSLAAMAAGALLGLAATEWVVRAVRAPATELGAYRPSSVLSKSLSMHGIWSLVVELAGQLFYLSVATFGLVPLGLGVGVVALWHLARGRRDAPTVVQAFAALSFLGVWVLSSLFMNLGNRADKLVYGRYNEGVIAPLLVVALAWVMAGRGLGRWWRWLLGGAGAVAASGAAVLLGDSKAALFGDVNPINVLGIQPVLTRMGEHLHVAALIGLGAGAIAALALLAWRFPAVAALLVIGAFATSAIDTETSYVVPGSRARLHQGTIVEAIKDIRAAGLGPDGCVAYDPTPLGFGDYNFYEDQLLVPDQHFEPMVGAAAPCGALVISRSRTFPDGHPGAREVTAEDFTGQVLWAVPSGPLFGALAANGWLSPAGASSPLSAAAFARGRVLAPPTVSVAAGTAAAVVVVVEHGPGGAPWPAVNALHTGSGKYGVRMTVQADGPPGLVTGGMRGECLPAGSPLTCQRVELPQTLLPGQSVALVLQVHGLARGRYRVTLGLLQEGVDTFAAHAQVTVVVS